MKNLLKEIRKKSGLSQAEFAKKFSIPKKTLQKWEHGESEPLPYLMALIQDEVEFEEYIDIEKYRLKPTNNFKKVINSNFKNINRIHPIQQQRVSDIIEAISKYMEVKKIVVFGSSVTSKCNYDSDIDLYVELSKNINVKDYVVDCPVDYWTNFSVVPEMMNEIKKTGVTVYDCK